jgi:hypothetical protein
MIETIAYRNSYTDVRASHIEVTDYVISKYFFIDSDSVVEIKKDEFYKQVADKVSSKLSDPAGNFKSELYD